jgi:hypoxia up-regulated 1
VESLYNDIDYRSHVSRSTFEDVISPLASRFSEPISAAISQVPDLTLANITSVILFGGNTRVPLVLAQVKDTVGAERIAQNVNADEGAVLGAAFHGAGLSRQFKTKDIKLSDRIGYEIVTDKGEVVFGPDAKAGDKAVVIIKDKSDQVSVNFKYSSCKVSVAVSLVRFCH